ncbi:MAG: histidinol-phosphatase HisJ family protein, partial [Chloroflexota bacterium]
MLSYHGAHSKDYCSHATDSLRTILDTYADASFRYLGVTEHLPSRTGYLYPEEEDLGVAGIEARFNRLMDMDRSQLHEQYDGVFADFRVGFETEFYGSDSLDHLLRMIERYRPEIVVVSVHHVRDIPIDFSLDLYKEAVTKCGNMQNLFCAYYDQQYELIQLLADYVPLFPVVLGHMDLIKLYQTQADPGFAPTAQVWDRIVRNIRSAVAGGL